MKLNRTQNAGRNMIFGGILKIYDLLVPFIMRTVMLYFLGVQYLGLSNLFSSILQVLNLAELGVGSAMVYSMYKPIAENDTDKICALMKLYKVYYRIIGIVIAVLGVLLLPFIPKLIEGDIPNDINVYVLYLINLSATVLSYWLFAYKNSIIQAHQRADIGSKVSICTSTLQYLIQLFAIIVLKNYYVYIITMLATQALTNVVTAIVVDKLYPNYKAKGNLDKRIVYDINRKIKDLFTSKFSYVIVSSSDSVVISAFLGLTILAVYQNYYFLMQAISSLLYIIFSSCMAGIGNSLIVESKKKNLNDLKKFTFIISWIAGFCTCCFACLYQPFITIWVGEEYLLDYSIVICLCIYFFVSQINQLLNTYKDAAGIWHEDRFRPIITALTNLILNVILVNYIGLYGVILSTVFSIVVIGIPWLLHNLFKLLFDKSQIWNYISKLIGYILVTILSCFISYILCSFIHVPVIWKIVLNLLVCLIVPNTVFGIIYYKSVELKESIDLLNSITKGKLVFINKYLNKKSNI